ncbi:MAG: GTP-sensing pleiotropic transcriptional regulator CodY [Acetobacteraceae bacterium]|nr:GTP-sensing pleiotropic transcriptional regulator CodY [Acetobacteraceae bacterium]
MNLLEKTRRMNRLIQKAETYPIGFGRMAEILCELLGGNVYLVDAGGRILGHALIREFECEIMVDQVLREGQFPADYNDKLLQMKDTSPNITQERRKCVFKKGVPCIHEGKISTIVPVYGGGERLGTLVVARYHGRFSDGDLILAEYAATMVGMEMMRELGEEREERARRRTAVEVAIDTLSYSELEAIQHIFERLEGGEGLLVASKIADRVGITRSVIVNALRKFESAGVIESRSLGMKGTHIKVLNPYLLPELARRRAQS